jgi:hypothetical protein
MGRFDPTIRRVFLAAAVVWAATILIAPALIDAGGGASSVVALAIYSGCAAICHQRPERSFQLFHRQMPVCARCTGIYVAAALTALVMLERRTREGGFASASGGWSRWSIALASTLPSLATLVCEWTTGHMPSNWTRAAAGFPMGAVASWLVLRPFDGAPERPEPVEGRIH